MGPPATSPGYSLIELLVVLAIMALIVTVAAPAVSTSLDRMTLNADARALATQLRAWRDSALDRQMEITVTVNEAMLRSSEGELQLSSGTTVEMGSTNTFVVGSDGTTAAALRLTRGSASMRVVMNRLTGRVIVEDAP